MSAEFTVLTEKTCQEFIAGQSGFILFHKKLCPHCKVMHTVLAKTLLKDASLAMAVIDSEEEAGAMAACGVERVPTLLAVKNGAIAAKKTGVMNPAETLEFYRNA